MLKKLLLLLVLATTGFAVSAQKATIKGYVVDTTVNQQLQNSSILLIRNADSVLYKSIRADATGFFEFKNIPKGRYQLIVTYPKMADYIANFNLSDSSKIDMGKINMDLQSQLINEVVIRAQRDAIRVRGDTITYQADSFKVAEGANAQELLKRLPGFEIDKDGNIKAQGKEVVNLLVDGDEFFGDDPLLATKYLKANAIKEVEVYDKKSKNTELTGIDDGEKEKTVNLKLKDNAKNGYLSNLDFNSNGENLKDYGGMFGIFKNKLKAAVYGTKSNLGTQSKVNQAMNSLKGGDYDIISISGDGGGAVMVISGAANEDSFNSQDGLPNNLTLGAHFSNKWNNNKSGLKVNYKYLDREITSFKTSNGQQLLPNGNLFISSGNTNDQSQNVSNDLKTNYEVAIDSLSSLKFSFGVKNATTDINSTGFNETHNGNGLNVSENNQRNTGVGTADVYNGNINYTKRFQKKGRTFSMDVQPEYKNSTSILNSLNRTLYYDVNGVLNKTDDLNLLKDNSGTQQSIATKLSYSEPLNNFFTLQATYSFKNTNSESYKNTYDKNIKFGNTFKQVDSLSNNFKFNSLSHVGKGVLQFRYKKLRINGGLEATQTSFDLNDLDRANKFSRNYLNLGPSSNINLQISRSSNISMSYNGNTRQPSLDQLQPIREINNPLYQIIGNPNLRPSFNNTISLNYNAYRQQSEEFMYADLNYSFVNNDIINTELIDKNNKRTVSYININGNKNISGGMYYSKGFTKLKLRMSAGIGFSHSEGMAILNNILNKPYLTVIISMDHSVTTHQKYPFIILPVLVLQPGHLLSETCTPETP